MDLSENIEHHFDLEGLKLGDTFLGCNKCWFRLDPHTAANLICPYCKDKNRMSLFNVTEDDFKSKD